MMCAPSAARRIWRSSSAQASPPRTSGRCSRSRTRPSSAARSRRVASGGGLCPAPPWTASPGHGRMGPTAGRGLDEGLLVRPRFHKMKPALRLFYAADIHGSERVFRKFLNAAPFYGASAVIFGGDITGKAIVPLVEFEPGRYRAHTSGGMQEVDDGEALRALESHIRDGGSYPYRSTPDEVAAM